MKKISLMVTLLAAALLGGQAWAWSATYSACLTANVSESGAGKVYASTSNTTPTDDQYSDTMSVDGSTSKEGSSGSAPTSQTLTFYIRAISSPGYKFIGWTKTDDSATIADASKNSTTVTYAAASGDEKTPFTVTAQYEKITLQAFGISFLVDPTAGAYKVDDVEPANRTGLTEVTTVKLSSDDPNFLSWSIDGADVFDNPYYLTCIESTTVSATFLTADMLAEVTTLNDLKAALAQDSGKKKITIPSGTEIAIAQDDSVEVPQGKQLVVDGTVFVSGALTVEGAVSGAGKVVKINRIVSQGPVITPKKADGTEILTYVQPNLPTMINGRYRETEISETGVSVTGNALGCDSAFGVLLKRTDDGVTFIDVGYFEINSENPVMVQITVDTDAINTIKTISGGQSESSSSSHNYLLFADGSIGTGCVGTKGNTFNGIVDCAGSTCSILPVEGTDKKTTSIMSGFGGKFLNGKVKSSCSYNKYWQQGKASFYNCSEVTLSYLKNTGNGFAFLNCGTKASPAKLSFGYGDTSSSATASSSNYRTADFMGGYYQYTFSDTNDKSIGKSYIRAGSFTSDPTKTAIIDTGLEVQEVQYDGSKYYEVYKPAPKPDVVKIGENGYKSLQEAVTAAGVGARIELAEEIVLDEQLSIPSDKQLTLDLKGRKLSGASIVNEGKLRFEDTTNSQTPGVMSVPVINKGNGTIDITYGTYVSTIDVQGGTVTTHGGTFDTTFAATENGGTVHLRGGSYSCPITVPEGFKMSGDKLGPKTAPVINPNNPISTSTADYSYTIKGLPDDDKSCTLYTKYKSGDVAREHYTDAEWDRVAELRYALEPIEGNAFEASIAFDRDVKANSFYGVVKAVGIVKSMPLACDVAAGEDYHVMIPTLEASGYTAKDYLYMFDGTDGGNWATLLCGGRNESLDNIGTTCTLKFQLRYRKRASDYQSTNPKYDDTFEDLATHSHKITGQGAIAGGTDYTSLASAIDHVSEGGTIRLSLDCNSQVTINKAMSFTLDTNNFAFTGEIVAGEGYAIQKGDNGKYTVFKVEPTTAEVVKPTSEGEKTYQVEVKTDKLAELGVDMSAAPEKIQEQAAEVLNARHESGLKNWEVIVVEQAKAEQTTPVVVLANVIETKDATEKKVLTTGEKAAEANVDLALLPAGTYRKAYVAKMTTTDSQPADVTIAVPEEPTLSIVRNESKDKTIILPVPGTKNGKTGGTVSIGTIIDPASLTKGDVVTYYDADKTKRMWAFEGNDVWTEVPTITGGVQAPSKAAGECCPPEGGAFWLTRANPEKPVVIVTEAADEIAPTVTKGEWNLEANPDPVNEVAVKAIVQNPNAGDQVIIPTDSGVQRKVSFNDGKWTYKKTTVKGGKVVTEWVDATIKPSQGFWYVSDPNAAKDTQIKWK